MREIFSWTMVILSIFVIIQRNPTRAVLLRLALSVFAVATYLSFMAPDVALAEAMLGSLLTTFVYILMLKSPVSLRVGYVPTKFLIEEHIWGMDGIMKEIVEKFAEKRGYSVEYVKFSSVEDLIRSVESGYIDIGCGPIVKKGIPIIKTKVFLLSNGEKKDFLSMSKEDFKKILKWEEESYNILSNKSEFDSFLKSLIEEGILDEIVKKYTG